MSEPKDSYLKLTSPVTVYSGSGCDVYKPEMIEFDGFTFFKGYGTGSFYTAVVLDIAYRARRGDQVATQLLNGFKIVIENHDRSKSYWPMEVGT